MGSNNGSFRQTSFAKLQHLINNSYPVPSLKLTQHLEMDGWNTSFLLGSPIFRGYVSFRECNIHISRISSLSNFGLHMSPDQISLLPFYKHRLEELKKNMLQNNNLPQKYPSKIPSSQNLFFRSCCISFISTFTSGIMHKSTTSAAVAACMATKPESRPINLTMPTPAVLTKGGIPKMMAGNGFQYGGFLQWWYPTTIGFPTKNDHFGVFWGVPPFKETPIWPFLVSMLDFWWKFPFHHADLLVHSEYSYDWAGSYAIRIPRWIG